MKSQYKLYGDLESVSTALDELLGSAGVEVSKYDKKAPMPDSKLLTLLLGPLLLDAKTQALQKVQVDKLTAQNVSSFGPEVAQNVQTTVGALQTSVKQVLSPPAA